jgi:hypothetical protein
MRGTPERAYSVLKRTRYALSEGAFMRGQQPINQTMKISDVRGHLNTLVNQVYRKETRVVVE